jgi:hypothetical protein
VQLRSAAGDDFRAHHKIQEKKKERERERERERECKTIGLVHGNEIIRIINHSYRGMR